MADIQAAKERVQREVDLIAAQLTACSDWMADHPLGHTLMTLRVGA